MTEKVTPETISSIALALRTARKDKSPIPAPTKSHSLTVNDGWSIQQELVAHSVQNGDRIVGYKLGNIAKVMQDAFGLDQPDYGVLLASTFVYEGTSLNLKDYIKPYVELEPAFILKGKLKGPNVTVADVINAIEYAIPAIEIIDSRVQNWEIDLPDTLADNGSTGAVILGGTPKRLTELNLRDTRGYLQFQGKEVISGNTGYVLGNPLNAVAWLVNRLSEWDVEFLPGQVILPGSCLQAVPMVEGGRWRCVFEGWGEVEFDVSV
ncbi:putative TodF product hydratase [Aspergillus crustosus]